MASPAPERPAPVEAVRPPFSKDFAAQIFPEDIRQVCTWWAPAHVKRTPKWRDCPCETHGNGAPPLWAACVGRLADLSGEPWDSHDQLLSWHLKTHYSATRAVYLARDDTCPLEVSGCGRYAVFPVCVFHRREPMYLVLKVNANYKGVGDTKNRYWFFAGWHTYSSLVTLLSREQVSGITLQYAPVPQQTVARGRFALFEANAPLHFDKNDPGHYCPDFEGVSARDFEDAVRKSMRCARHRGPWVCWLARSNSVAYMTFFNAPETQDGAHLRSYFLVFRPTSPGRMDLVAIFDAEQAYAASRALGSNFPTRYRPQPSTERDGR